MPKTGCRRITETGDGRNQAAGRDRAWGNRGQRETVGATSRNFSDCKFIHDERFSSSFCFWRLDNSHYKAIRLEPQLASGRLNDNTIGESGKFPMAAGRLELASALYSLWRLKK
jgi:hypothetical protein